MLLTKYERSQVSRRGVPSKQRPQFSFAGSELEGDYFDELDFSKKEDIHKALRELESTGIVELKWERFKDEVRKVYLNTDRIQQAYNLVDALPKEAKLNSIREVLEGVDSHPWDWVRDWVRDAVLELENYKVPVGMDAEDPLANRQLVRILCSLPALTLSIPKRVLSQDVLHDSKRFEQSIEKRLLTIVKKYGPQEYEKESEYLDSLGIVEYPQLSLVAGPVKVCVNEKIVDLGDLPGGAGLSGETIQRMTLFELSVSQVICVENLTSFHELVHAVERKREDGQKGILVIYIGGFPHRGLQSLLYQVKDHIESLPLPDKPELYHWGDLDYGGIRIFEYMRQNFFADLKPLYMDEKTYLTYLDRGVAFQDSYAKRLEALMNDERYEHWRPLVATMLHHRKRVEQESVRVVL